MKYVQLDGVRIAYRDAGVGNPPLLFIHGGACNHRAWLPQQKFFSRGHHCIAVDLRGCGQSEPTPPYGLDQQVADVAALVKKLELPPAVAIGHSLGGLTALSLNARHPDLVRAVVVVDAPLSPSGVQSESAAAALWEAGSTNLLVDRFFGEADSPARRAVAPMIEACPLDVAVGMLEGAALTGGEVLRLVESARHKPLLAVWPVGTRGERPRGGDPDWLQSVVPSARHAQVPNGGHFLQLRCPDLTNAHLRSFIDGLDLESVANTEVS